MLDNCIKKCWGVILLFIGLMFFSIPVYATQSRVENFNKAFSLGADQADNMVIVAQSQLGKKKADLGYTEAWCADFVCDCGEVSHD